jgi:hypothetical protein
MHTGSCFESLHPRSSRLPGQSDAGGNSESQKDANESRNSNVKFASHFPSTKDANFNWDNLTAQVGKRDGYQVP